MRAVLFSLYIILYILPMSNPDFLPDGLTFSPMQVAARDAIAGGGDVVLSAPTGSGKTLAFLVPLAAQLSASLSARALVICPTRELARQNMDVWRSLSTAIPALSLHGGRPMGDDRVRLQADGWRIIFATPGRLLAHLSEGNLCGEVITALVIDEYDKCLELGFEAEMSAVAGRLTGLKQRVLVSATPLAELSAYLACGECTKLDFLPREEDTNGRIRQMIVRTGADSFEALCRMLCAFGGEPAIVFVTQRTDADDVGRRLSRAGFEVAVCHGGQEQAQRERSIFRFRSQCAPVLVTTNLGARGLDIPAVRHVVHYHLPDTADDYLHRIGRTARWQADGTSWLMLGQDAPVPDYAAQAAEAGLPAGVGRPARSEWKALYVGLGKRAKISKADLLGWLCKTGGAASADVGTIEVSPAASYVALRNKSVTSVLRLLAGTKLKGHRTIIEPLRN